MCLDNADDDEGGDLRTACGCTAPSRARGEEANSLQQEAGSNARRWVVERTQSGMTRFRGVLIRWDTHVPHDRACLHVACIYLTYRPSGLAG